MNDALMDCAAGCAGCFTPKTCDARCTWVGSSSGRVHPTEFACFHLHLSLISVQADRANEETAPESVLV